MRLFWILMIVLGAGLLILLLNSDGGSIAWIEQDDFASLLYYGLWGSALIVGLLSSRISFGRAFRDLAYWLVIILFFSTIYRYQTELLGLFDFF